VQFKVFPFKYSVNAVRSHADDLTLTSPTTINNKGTVYSQPTITVYSTGDITLTINDTDYGLLGVEEYITIDSELMEVYKGTANANNKYSAMDFPRFEVGENRISWTGNVTKIEIEPKWRWL
jgi:phage-related protein